MRIAVVACELPHPEGTAAGRDLWAWCEGMRSLGHDVEAWVWFRSPSSPDGPVPEWCRYEPFDPGPAWRSHLRAVVVPRNDLARAGWRAPDDAVAVADHLPSAAAVLGSARSAVTLHFRALADARAVGRVRPPDVQMGRAERRVARRAGVTLVYSQRVGRGLAGRTRVVPIAYPVPDEAVTPVDEPVAALLADWSWPPNREALAVLLRSWTSVRDAVPGARLLLAGKNLDRAGVGAIPGVEAIGPVARSADVLSRTAVVAFPCPPSSGPKIKVIEALAHGVPVVTTPAGMEGVATPPGASPMVAGRAEFAGALVRLLRDPALRQELGRTGRMSVAEHHSPTAAATARLRAFAEVLGAEAGSSTPSAPCAPREEHR